MYISFKVTTANRTQLPASLSQRTPAIKTKAVCFPCLGSGLSLVSHVYFAAQRCLADQAYLWQHNGVGHDRGS